jgi:GxxExxY protein
LCFDHRWSADSADNANRLMTYLYEDLSKKIIGAAFTVYNTLGYGYKEKDFQKALAAELTSLGFKVTRELYSRLEYKGKIISGFYVDFLVECGDERIIVELKIAEKIYQKHFYQVLAYLKNNQLPLGLLIVFTDKKVLVKRIINERSAKSAPSANNL